MAKFTATVEIDGQKRTIEYESSRRVSNDELLKSLGVPKGSAPTSSGITPGLERERAQQLSRRSVRDVVSDIINRPQESEAGLPIINPAINLGVGVATGDFSNFKRDVSALPNIVPDQEMEGAVNFNRNVVGDVLSDVGLGLETVALPFAAIESPLAAAGLEMQAADGKPYNAFMDALLGNRTGKFEDVIQSFASEETKPLKFFSGAVGLLASIGVGSKLLSTAAKGAAKTKGDDLLLEQTRNVGKITDNIHTATFNRLNDFYRKINRPIDGAKVSDDLVQLGIGDVPPGLRKALNRELGENIAPKDILSLWKTKKVIGKEMRNVWAKRAKDVPLDSGDKALEKLYFGVDDLIYKNAANESERTALRAINKQANETLSNTGVVRGLMLDKTGKFEDTSQIKTVFTGSNQSTKRRYFERLEKLDKNILNVQKEMARYARNEKIGKFIKRGVRVAAGGAIAAGVGAPIVGRQLRGAIGGGSGFDSSQ